MITGALMDNVLGEVLRHAGEPDELVVRHLRAAFAGVHFSMCSDDDMPARVPFAAENPYCRLYGVKSGEHCVSLTTDLDAATGLVVALVDRDE